MSKYLPMLLLHVLPLYYGYQHKIKHRLLFLATLIITTLTLVPGFTHVPHRSQNSHSTVMVQNTWKLQSTPTNNKTCSEGRVKCYTNKFQIPYYRKKSDVERELLLTNNNDEEAQDSRSRSRSSTSCTGTGAGIVTILDVNMRVKGETVRMRKQNGVSQVRQRKVGKLDGDLRDFDEALVGKYWAKRFHELLDFKTWHGHCLVPRFYSENVSLGSWVFTQRQQYRVLKKGLEKSNMTDERIRLLEKAGFIWIAQISFEQRIEELQDYKNQFGNCNVPQFYKTNIGLGNFVNKCRHEYKRFQMGKKSTMTRDRIIALERLGFVWDMKRDALSWEDRLSELEHFKLEFNTTDVPQNYPVGHPYRSLGLWVKNQRYQYTLAKKGKKNTLTTQRIKSLEQEGFTWESRSGSKYRNDK